MRLSLQLIDEDTLALQFPYDAGRVACLKTLACRKWNPAKKRWEVHLRHLPELVRIFHLTQADVPDEIRRLYAANWSAGRGARVALGSLAGKITGAIPSAAIDAATSFEMPGHEYSELFKQGRWDGRRHLFNRQKQEFPAGLWPRIKAVLEANEVQYKLDEVSEAEAGGQGRRVEKLDFPPPGPEARSPRPYQAETVERALTAGRGIIQIATGGGKTVVAAQLIRRLARPAIFFVHTLDLLYQAASVFERELGIEIGLLGDGQASLRPVTVATVQTASRLYDAASVRASDRAAKLLQARAVKASRAKPARPAKNTHEPAGGEEDEADPREERPLEIDEATRKEISLAIARAEMVIFDECHHVPAEMFYKIAMKTRAALWRYGLSATPWRDDGNDLLLEAALGPKISEINCSTLIDAGFLVAPVIHVEAAPGPRIAKRGARYPDVYRRAIVENRERNRLIAVQARAWAQAGRSTLILVAHVAHGRMLEEMLPEAAFCWGGLDGETRQRQLKALEQKLAPIMIATTLADEGLDVPALGGVILAGGGKSPTRAFQRIGRALRLAPGKTDALILDFFDDVPYLREHSQARMELYRQEPRFTIETTLPLPMVRPSCPTATF